MLQKKHKIHFIGIGGIGMSGIAEVLLNSGYVVSGSDLQESEATRRLRALGARVFVGHREANLAGNPSVVVISTAVKYSNPEVLEARRRHIPVIPRAEMLAELMRMKSGIAVAGTHGKTTTTSLIAAILARGGLDPTVVIGGRVHSLGSNAQLGKGELMVTEADESDGTFLMLSPTIAVVTNVEPEHLDHYGDMERVKAAYVEFINRIPFFGAAVLCLDDVTIRSLLPQIRKRVVTYGTSPEADFVAQDAFVHGMETSVLVRHGGCDLGELSVRLPGRHQALNAVAAVAVAHELGVSFEVAVAALSEFGGIHRRFEVCGESGGVMVVSDYGHHPTEIRATLSAAREGFNRRLVVVFQPHRYTRLRDLFTEFLDAFDHADKLYLTDVYPAGEDPIEGVNGELLHFALKRRGHLDVAYVPDWRRLVATIQPELHPGDLVVVLGAGNIHDVGEDLVRSLSGSQAGFAVQ
jgi:UDP-N-acetylmuramate--alanine ligase